MGVDAFGVLDEVLGDYRSFVEGFLNIQDERVKAKVDAEIEKGLLWPEPWLALNPAFESGGTVGQLVDNAVLAPAALDIFRLRTGEHDPGTELAFHRHQVDAFEVATRRESYVLTTGTGSGKSLSYIVPIVDRVLREGSGNGVRAIVVYPMNALANSQLNELEKFLGRVNPKVTFERYTGQEDRTKREHILANPPDILLTNYVMLELMLTRPMERAALITGATNLSFLVLDELHTYRGRQGADVAMLVRRLRGAVGATELQCIGTSATLAGPGTKAEQRQQVADLATRIFGTPIAPSNVIGETLCRATTGDVDTAALTARLRAPTPGTWEELHRDPLAVWVEETFGLDKDDEGRLARQSPKKLSAAATDLHQLTGIDEDTCRGQLRDLLLTGSRVRDPGGRPLFAFKLHQFIGKGDTVYTTLEPAATRYLTTQYQRSAPIEPLGRPLFPLAFCRECGQDFVVVSLDKGGEKFSPRPLNDTRGEQAEATGLLYLSDGDWPDPSNPALLERVPDDWIITDDGTRSFDKARETRLPTAYRVDQYGTVLDDDDGLAVAFFGRLDFCPSCKTSYESSQQSEFSRVASLGTEGRASAVTVLTQSVVRVLRTQTDLDDDARKFLAFTDNRQDASLQAGHFNDFVLVGLVRSALYRAALQQQERDPDEPLTDEDIGREIVKALGGDLRHFARDPDTAQEAIAAKKINSTLRDVVSYRVWADLKRGWRITMPNLEQTGQLSLTYTGIDAVAADEAKWQNTIEPLASAEPTTRAAIMHVLLDELRRNLCIESEFLTEDKYDSVKRLSAQWLKAPWTLTDETGVYAGIAYPGGRTKGSLAFGGDLYVSGLGLYGRWLRRPDRFPLHEHALKPADAEAVIAALLKVMADASILSELPGPNKRTGYQIKSSLIEWRAAPGDFRAPDPIRGNQKQGRINPFFKELYAETARALIGLEAREHTAQVEAALRQEREALFSDATLPVLYCSPTMELGVDIRSLNVVGMRNVPPTPANYAQRSGRAGRSGQPAVVLTYCATGNAHDSYYFSRSQDMVAGAVTPPRLELGNQDLVRAHAHSIWLAACGLDLKASMVDLVEIETDGRPLRSTVLSTISSPTARAQAVAAITDVLAATPEVTSAAWWTPDWIADTVERAPTRFDEAADRWRTLYDEAQRDLDTAGAVLKEIGASEPAKRAAKARITEARAALDLLKGLVEDIAQSDFYPYRYFASEGFLPGYSFPRLPLAAFIPADRKTATGRGDYVQRPRFVAISEFGPDAFIYHEGARYQVDRVSLPAADDGAGVSITEIKRCNVCGYLHENSKEVEICQLCGSSSLEVLNRMMRLMSVKTRRRDRISADEEERQRAGYDIVTSIRFVPHGERAGQVTSTITVDGQTLGSMTYGDTAQIRRMNVGLRRRKDKHLKEGYLLDTLEGRWARAADIAKNIEGQDPRIRHVIPYVEDRRNAVLFELDPAIDTDERRALMYALKRAIETVYQLESSELAVEPLPGSTGDHAWSRLLFFEAAEGGAGVLRRVATEDGQLAAVARKALELLHFDPDTGEDRHRAEYAREDMVCAQACYDCLLSYSNQSEHQHLDRHNAAELLQTLMRSHTETPPDEPAADEQFAKLAAASNSLETQFLKVLHAHGYRLPDEAQQIVEGYYVRPDFAYHVGSDHVAVFLDGPVHDDDHQKGKDEQARAKLVDELGWLVLRFHYSDAEAGWLGTITAHPDVFGTGKTGS